MKKRFHEKITAKKTPIEDSEDTTHCFISTKMEATRISYLDQCPELRRNPHRLKLLLWRHAFLAKNPLFVREWREAHAAYRLEPMAEHRQKQRKAFRDRWGICFISGLFSPQVVRGAAVQLVDSDRRAGSVTFKFDLRYSQDKIHEAFAALLGHWHAAFREELESEKISWDGGSLPHWFDIDDSFEEMERYQGVEVMSGNERKDTSDYATNLRAWEMKEEQGLSWSQVCDRLGIPTSTARGKVKSAAKMIREGIPGFPPFPKE